MVVNRTARRTILIFCASAQGRRRRHAEIAVDVRVGGEEDPAAGGHNGAASRGQYTRAQAHVQPERGVRQAAAQGADVRVRKAPVPDRDAPAGHHVHRLHVRAAPDRAAAVGRGGRRCPAAVVFGRVRAAAALARRPVRALLADPARLGGHIEYIGEGCLTIVRHGANAVE